MKDGENMEPYKEMYCHMAHEVEKAIRVLVQAQQDCEELYLQAADKAETPAPAKAPDETLREQAE